MSALLSSQTSIQMIQSDCSMRVWMRSATLQARRFLVGRRTPPTGSAPAVRVDPAAPNSRLLARASIPLYLDVHDQVASQRSPAVNNNLQLLELAAAGLFNSPPEGIIRRDLECRRTDSRERQKSITRRRQFCGTQTDSGPAQLWRTRSPRGTCCRSK